MRRKNQDGGRKKMDDELEERNGIAWLVSDGKIKFLSEEEKCDTGFKSMRKRERERGRKKDEEEKSYSMKIIPSVKPTEENEQMRKGRRISSHFTPSAFSHFPIFREGREREKGRGRKGERELTLSHIFLPKREWAMKQIINHHSVQWKLPHVKCIHFFQ